MSVVGSLIATIATRIGAELVGKAVSGRFGEAGGQLAESVITTVAERLGVDIDEVPAQPEAEIEAAVKETETMMPEMIALWSQGLDGQFALLRQETAAGFWHSAWRWGWMYLLALFWSCYILVFPVLDVLGFAIERIDVAILLTLTTWFISLYMGGHTVKALGESAINAVRSWRGRV
ncbi:hypothetical protein FQ775_01100 [Nitratireductor mangrovi]|uniref:Holin of 3TMs, for gene-transfer release n=1 Tax=Nitratireductor mangrovi TaxID=2599600 RepID=A0A5B8KU51_9HYPH|nr:hypothetical protein [Nitratireductor mangrovi]QDY99079.1 hypothetical protein FQ775_01100 [Nitratireductor mangrovi]